MLLSVLRTILSEKLTWCIITWKCHQDIVFCRNCNCIGSYSYHICWLKKAGKKDKLFVCTWCTCSPSKQFGSNEFLLCAFKGPSWRKYNKAASANACLTWNQYLPVLKTTILCVFSNRESWSFPTEPLFTYLGFLLCLKSSKYGKLGWQ